MVDLVGAVLGVVVLSVVGIDVLWTSLSPVSGPGPVTRWWGRLLWIGVGRRIGDPTSPWWHLLGPAVLVATVGSWVALLVVGWWLVLGAMGSVVDVVTRSPVGPGRRLYFVVSAVSTLGLGDVVATTAPGRTVTVLAAVTGLGLVTLAVTYVLPVLTAVTDRRVVATTISAVGTSAGAIVDSLDDTVSPQPLLDEVGSSLRLLAQRHRAYPILHFFHSTDRAAALAPSIAALDEALAVLGGRAGWNGPPSLAIRRLRAAVDDLLEVTQPHLASIVREQTPRAPGRVGQVSCRHSLDEHRRQLHALVVDDGWSWDGDVLGDGVEGT